MMDISLGFIDATHQKKGIVLHFVVVTGSCDDLIF